VEVRTVVPFDPELDLPPEQPNAGKHWLIMAAVILACTPITLFGVLLCVSLVFLPIGILLLILSAIPAYLVEQKYERKLHAWKDRDHPLYDDDDPDHIPPWMLDE